MKAVLLVLLFTLIHCLDAVPTPKQGEDGDPQITNSVIDVLSNNVEFSIFLRIIQRKELVPILNSSENFTLLLPINSAFTKADIVPESFDRYIINEVIVTDDYMDSKSKLFIASDKSPILLHWIDELGVWHIDESEIVDGNMYANAQNAMVQGIDSLLPLHQNTCDLLTKHSNTTVLKFDKFTKILVAEDICQSLSNLTGLIPLDSGLHFNEVEMSYLTYSENGASDRNMYLQNHFIEGLIGGNVSVMTQDLLGNDIMINTTEKDTIMINDRYEAKRSDFLTNDSILHFFNTDSFIQNPLVFTPRKYLHGLNASNLVKELDFRKLSYLIDDNQLEQTVFVNISDDDEDEDSNSITIQSNTHKNNDMYQFVSGIIGLNEDVLLSSKYCYKKLGDHCQRIKVTKITEERFILNNHVYVDRNSCYRVGNTNIYLIDDDLSPPARLDLSIGPYYHSTRSVKYLNDLNLINLPNNKQGYTIFIPSNDAWEDLELTWSYLLQNMTALALVMETNIINGLVYSDFEGELETTSINDEKVSITKTGDQMIVNNNVLPITKNSDILFAQGVAHSISSVLFPNDMDITIINLLDSVNHEVYKDFLEFSHLLSLIESGEYSLLLPSETSLLHENITLTYPKLNELLRLHLIPLSATQLLLDCSSKIPTLLNDTNLSCRELTPGILMLQVLEGNDKEVRIVKRGCTSSSYSSDQKQCLFLLDRPINPDWIDKPFIGLPHIKLPAVAMGIGAIVTLIVVLLCLSCCMVCFIGKNNTEEQLYDEQPSDDDDEHRELVDHGSLIRDGKYGSNGYTSPNLINNNDANNGVINIEGFSEQDYSANAKSRAINVKPNKSGALDGIVSSSVNGHHDHQKKSFW